MNATDISTDSAVSCIYGDKGKRAAEQPQQTVLPCISFKFCIRKEKMSDFRNLLGRYVEQILI